MKKETFDLPNPFLPTLSQKAYTWVELNTTDTDKVKALLKASGFPVASYTFQDNQMTYCYYMLTDCYSRLEVSTFSRIVSEKLNNFLSGDAETKKIIFGKVERNGKKYKYEDLLQAIE